MIEQLPLGRTGLRVSRLGFGAMHINDERVSEAEAGHLLNSVLDLGITLIDTARSYGLSEARIGQHLAHRRQEFILSTKLGYGVEGQADWSYGCIVQGVERALRLMRCDWLDIAHLHSCPLATLQRGEVIRALQDCQQAGKLRVAAYSGDNAELDFALACGAFGSVQTSISLCDQINLSQRLPQAAASGIGVLAKRPVAGAVWRFAQRPEAFAEGHYWDRWQVMQLGEAFAKTRRPAAEPAPAPDWMALALRFTAFQRGVSSTLIGTSNARHLRQNLAALEVGPLSAADLALIDAAWLQHCASAPGLI